MLVTAYEAKFRALSRYATQLCFSPQERIRRFVKGLGSELRILALQVAATAKSFQEMVDFDVILGMTWLSPNFAILDCNAKTVTLAKPGTDLLVWEGDYTSNPVRNISFLRAKKMVSKGCLAFLAHLKDDTTQVPSIESVSVVREFLDVFPADLPGMPPDRDIDFCIDLEPGTRPISIPPYRMAPAELRELKAQLQELLRKGFIRPSASPWGAPVLFVKKKDGSFRMCIDYRQLN